VPDALAPLLREGRLRRERTSPQEVTGFLAIARTALDDASIPALSPSGRFKHAYDAAHALALCALRVNDVRPSTGLGHRAIAFEALPASIGLESRIASTLQRYHTRRNKSEYEGLATVSDKEARELVALATTLESHLVRWIGANRPQLVARP
jgi:hypothetical protein